MRFSNSEAIFVFFWEIFHIKVMVFIGLKTRTILKAQTSSYFCNGFLHKQKKFIMIKCCAAIMMC